MPSPVKMAAAAKMVSPLKRTKLDMQDNLKVCFKPILNLNEFRMNFLYFRLPTMITMKSYGYYFYVMHYRPSLMKFFFVE